MKKEDETSGEPGGTGSGGDKDKDEKDKRETKEEARSRERMTQRKRKKQSGRRRMQRRRLKGQHAFQSVDVEALAKRWGSSTGKVKWPRCSGIAKPRAPASRTKWQNDVGAKEHRNLIRHGTHLQKGLVHVW